MEKEICPQTNEPHNWPRKPYISTRSIGRVSIWECNNCLAVKIEQDRYNTDTQTVTIVSPY
jgi:hypothetical protein